MSNANINNEDKMEKEAGKLASEIAKKYGYDPDIIAEIAASLLEEINYHELAKSIRA